MKLLCEFKRDLAQSLIVGFSPRSIGVSDDDGFKAEYVTLLTEKYQINPAMDVVKKRLLELGFSVLRWEVIRRLSRSENIGAVLVTVEKIGGAS